MRGSEAAVRAVLVWGAIAISACSATREEKPPYLAACGNAGASCVLGIVRSSKGTPSDATGGRGAGGGAGGQPTQPGTPGKAVSVSGKMELYRDEQFSAKAGFAEPVTITADGPLGNRVSTLYLGNGVFTLEVKETTENWFSAKAEGGQDEVTTLWAFNTQASKTTNIVLSRSTAIDSIFSFARSPIPRSATAAHVVINVVDANGLPLAGVAVSAPADSFVAYASGLTWASTITETTALGRAFVGNLAAPTAGFRDVSLTLSGTLVRALAVRLSGGAVSIVTVRP